jgi:hypothetical protein
LYRRRPGTQEGLSTVPRHQDGHIKPRNGPRWRDTNGVRKPQQRLEMTVLDGHIKPCNGPRWRDTNGVRGPQQRLENRHLEPLGEFFSSLPFCFPNNAVFTATTRNNHLHSTTKWETKWQRGIRKGGISGHSRRDVRRVNRAGEEGDRARGRMQAA